MYYVLIDNVIVGKSSRRIRNSLDTVFHYPDTDYELGGTIIDGVYTPPVADETDEGGE